MKTPPSPACCKAGKPWFARIRRRDSFTLIELLVVVGIIAFMAVISLPNIVSTLRAVQITQGGQMLEAQLQEARQTALSQNRSVEVRFYRFIPLAGTTAYFTAFQTFIIATSGSATPADKVYTLPGNMIMDSGNATSTDVNGSGNGQTISTILGQATNLSGYNASSFQNFRIPYAGTNYYAVAFRFKPDGSTNLNPTTNNWYITIHAQTDGDNLKTAPKNYYTVQIDPYNGHIYDFHP